MPIDMSVVKRIAVQCDMALAPSGNGYWDNQEQLLKLAQACYAIGAQEQKEKIAKLEAEITAMYEQAAGADL